MEKKEKIGQDKSCSDIYAHVDQTAQWWENKSMLTKAHGIMLSGSHPQWVQQLSNTH